MGTYLHGLPEGEQVDIWGVFQQINQYLSKIYHSSYLHVAQHPLELKIGKVHKSIYHISMYHIQG